MEATMSPLQRAFNAFLLTMPPQQLEELLKYLQDARAQENGQILYPKKNNNASAGKLSDTHHEPAVSASSTPKSSTSRGKRLPEAKKRPLNSFIAFRSFYSVIFPDLTQKAKSGILRFLWQNDPFKAKWTILAKAYSIIRDDHEGAVSLEKFLELNARFIGIIESNRYLDVMGWQLNVDDQQQYTMARVKVTTTVEADLSTNYSVNDIVKNCYDTGYVSEKLRKNKASQNSNTPVMAFAAQPTLVVNKNNGIQISGNHILATGNCNANAVVEFPSPEQTEGTLSPNPSDMSAVIDGNPFEAMDVLGAYNCPQFQQEPFARIDYEFNNIQAPNFNGDDAFFPYDAALQTPIMQYDPLAQQQFGTFDFDRYINI